MPKVKYSGPSRADYKNIYKFISKDSPQNALQVLQRFEDALKLLSDNPAIGRERREIALGVHAWSVHNFVLFYRPIEDGILLLRVLHGALVIGDREVQELLP